MPQDTSANEDFINRRQVKGLEKKRITDKSRKDRRHHVESVDAVCLDGQQRRLHVERRVDDQLVAKVDVG